MIYRFALSFLCIELDRDKIFGVMLVYMLLKYKRTHVSSVAKVERFTRYCLKYNNLKLTAKMNLVLNI